MSWRVLLALAWLAAFLPAGGCAADPPHGGELTAAALPARPQDAAGAVIVAPSGVARSQKPEGGQVARGTFPPPEPPADTHPAAQILATVNNEPILREEVEAAAGRELANVRSSADRAELLKKTLDALIDREILIQELDHLLSRQGPQGAKILERIKQDASKEFEHSYLNPMYRQLHVSGYEELDHLFREHGQSLDLTRRLWERNWVAQNYLRQKIFPRLDPWIGHMQIAEYFDSHPEEFQFADSVDWQDLFVDSQTHGSSAAARTFAEVLATRLRRGEDFAALAKQYNTGDSALRNHEGVGHRRGEIRPPQAEPVLFRMKDGEIAVVEIASGCHVIRLVHRTFAGPMPFDDKVQKQIRDKLRVEAAEREKKHFLNDLRRKAVIERGPLTE
jgi:parvulin-like peptidyl-prolyl isomerase